MLQQCDDRRWLRLDLFLQKDVAGSVDDADADGFERHVEAGEIVHDPLLKGLRADVRRYSPWCGRPPTPSLSAGIGRPRSRPFDLLEEPARPLPRERSAA